MQKNAPHQPHFVETCLASAEAYVMHSALWPWIHAMGIVVCGIFFMLLVLTALVAALVVMTLAGTRRGPPSAPAS